MELNTAEPDEYFNHNKMATFFCYSSTPYLQTFSKGQY